MNKESSNYTGNIFYPFSRLQNLIETDTLALLDILDKMSAVSAFVTTQASDGK